MFLKVQDSTNKKYVSADIKNALDSKNLDLKNPTFFTVNKNLVYIMGDDTVTLKEDLDRTATGLSFVKSNYKGIHSFLVVMEVNNKLSIFIKENDNITVEENLSLDLSSLLVYYERYSESMTLFAIPSPELNSIITSLKEVYEIEEDIFEEINDKKTMEDLEVQVATLDYSEKIKNMFGDQDSKNKDKDKKKSKNKDKKSFKYRNEVITLLLILIVAGGGYYYYLDYKEQQVLEAQRIARLKAQKQKPDFSIANMNVQKVELIKKYTDQAKSPIFSLKKNSYTTYIYDINLSNKYTRVLKMSKSLFYVEGTLDKKETVKSYKELKKININELFLKHNDRGFKEGNRLIINKAMNKTDLLSFLEYIKYDNTYTFDIFIKNNEDSKVVQGDKLYSINLSLYRGKKAPRVGQGQNMGMPMGMPAGMGMYSESVSKIGHNKMGMSLISEGAIISKEKIIIPEKDKNSTK